MRLFVAVPVPPEARARLAGLCTGLPGVAWVPAENMHISLRFIGEVDRGTASDLDATLAAIRAPAFEVGLEGLGSFGQERQPRVLWVGVRRSPGLEFLHGKVESAVVRAGLDPEGRKYKPHLTLARFKGKPGARLASWLAGRDGFVVESFPVDRFTLVRSHLGGEGAHYEDLADYPLTLGSPSE